MISSCRKQNVKKVETPFVCLMQMYMFVIEVLQESISTQPLPGTPPGGPRHFQVLFLQVCNCSVAGKENVILTSEPFGQSQSIITAVVELLSNQNQIHILIHKLIHVEYIHSRRQHKC